MFGIIGCLELGDGVFSFGFLDVVESLELLESLEFLELGNSGFGFAIFGFCFDFCFFGIWSCVNGAFWFRLFASF